MCGTSLTIRSDCTKLKLFESPYLENYKAEINCCLHCSGSGAGYREQGIDLQFMQMTVPVVIRQFDTEWDADRRSCLQFRITRDNLWLSCLARGLLDDLDCFDIPGEAARTRAKNYGKSCENILGRRGNHELFAF